MNGLGGPSVYFEIEGAKMAMIRRVVWKIENFGSPFSSSVCNI
jgi:hypothetical protein